VQQWTWHSGKTLSHLQSSSVGKALCRERHTNLKKTESCRVKKKNSQLQRDMALLQHSVIINRRERERYSQEHTHAHKKERLEKNRVLDSSHGRLQSHRQRVKQTRHKITWAASASPCSRHPQHPRFVLCVVLCLGQNGLRAFTRCLILGHKSNEKKTQHSTRYI